MKTENLLLIDIETVPMYKDFQALTPAMQHLWCKKAIQLEPNHPHPEQLFEQRAGIYAEFGKIICIGLGYFMKEKDSLHLKIKTLAGDNEKELLKEFITICNTFFHSTEKQFCGHNIKEFDIPYICRRLFINQLPLPKVLEDLQSKKPWENPVMDTMQFWKFGEYKNFVSVDLLSNVLQIPTPKDDIDGSDVARVYWQENNLNRIITYCGKDIITVGQLFLRLHGLPLLTEEQVIFTDERT